MRSDPYTGMALLYKYLYVANRSYRALALWFPNITASIWAAAARIGDRKDIRLFHIAADAIWYSDKLRLKGEL